MTKQKSTKRALLMSGLALLMCVSMLIGSTFAWFTDSVTSAGNIIKSGTLDVTMEWADGTKAVPADDSTDWKDASAGAIFKSELWEPGYTEVRHIKIANEGTLALKYQLNIVANGEVSKLADVIDVYYVDPAVQVADRTALTDANKLGTLTQVLANISTTASGNLTAGDKDTITLALKMQESAGNEYQNLAIGSDFSIQLLATQLTSEKDSFDDQYDANAPVTEVATAEELQKVLSDGGYAKLTADIAVPNNKRVDIPANKIAALDLNGYTLTSKDGGGSNTMAIYIDKGAHFTLNDSIGTGKIVSSCYGVYVKQNARFTMNGGTIDVSGNRTYDIGVTVWNSAFIMNGGTINSQYGVWASNYYRDNGETGLNDCYVKIADDCTLNSTGYADVEIYDAQDTILDVPADVSVYPAVWDGTVVSSLEVSDDGWYHITSGAELAYLNTILNGMPEQEGIKVVLDADIDLGNKDWTPIGYLDICAFNGQFDGNGHTIKNVKVVASKTDGDVNHNAGLFGVVKCSFTDIFDLTVENITISGESERVGGIVGMMNGGTIKNCHVINADLQVGEKVGGIVGDLVGVEMANCTVKDSTLVSEKYAGALTARTREDGSSVSVSNCSATNCAVTGADGYVGELVGYQIVSVSLDNSTATNVTVTKN